MTPPRMPRTPAPAALRLACAQRIADDAGAEAGDAWTGAPAADARRPASRRPISPATSLRLEPRP